MKANGLLFVAILLGQIAAHGQGRFLFNNLVPPDIDARFSAATDAPGTSSVSGPAYTVELLGGPVGASTGQLIPLATTDFKSGAAAGYVNPVTVTVPGVPVGADAIILLRLIQPGSPIPITDTYGPYAITLAQPPRYLPLGTSPLRPGLVPEPPPLVLALLAFGCVASVLRSTGGEPTSDPSCSSSHFQGT